MEAVQAHHLLRVLRPLGPAGRRDQPLHRIQDDAPAPDGPAGFAGHREPLDGHAHEGGIHRRLLLWQREEPGDRRDRARPDAHLRLLPERLCGPRVLPEGEGHPFRDACRRLPLRPGIRPSGRSQRRSQALGRPARRPRLHRGLCQTRRGHREHARPGRRGLRL